MAARPLGKRHTPQRETIHSVIVDADGPITVDEIFSRAQEAVPNLGIATVYRTVKLLLEAGEITDVTLPDGQTRYEAAHLGHHHHFRCRKCGHVYDLDHCPVDIGADALPDGFVVEDHELTLLGICADCVKPS